MIQANKPAPPIGIIITFGQEMIKANGGLWLFVKAFEELARFDDMFWLHKCKSRPQFDAELGQIYIIIGRRIYCRRLYGGYETGHRKIIQASGLIKEIEWPRIVLAGEVEKPPHKIPMRGFQGFRYIYEPLW